MAINTLSTTFKANVSYDASNNITGSDYSPYGTTGSLNKQYVVGTAAANAASSGGDQFVSYILSLAASASSTVDLSALTNILQQASITLVRIKGIMVRLLSTTDDSVYGTACSQIIFGNQGGAVASPSPIDLGGGSGCTVTITVSAGAITGASVGAGGTGYPPSATFCLVVLGAGTGGIVAATTNSSGVVTSVTFLSAAAGSGYSAATVATLPVGYEYMNNGGCKMYFDPTAAGFVTVSSTQKNLKFTNNDSAVAAAIQITLVGGST